jgi:mannitol-1-phosphate 5-dehydrogenase
MDNLPVWCYTVARKVMTMTQSALIFGAGNVGRGFLGQLFSESGYSVTFVDVDEPLVDQINSRGSYTISLVDNDLSQEVIVGRVQALLTSQPEAVVEQLAQSTLAATAVGARALPHIAPLVAAGIALRAARNVQAPLNLIVCENLHDAANTLRGLVLDKLDSSTAEYLTSHVGFVDTVIGRMVPPLAPELREQDPSFVVVEPYKELPVDRAGFVGPIPEVVGLEACDNFPAYTARKLYIHNCGHAMLAYLGYLRRHEFGYQALEDPAILPLFRQALAEAQAGIVEAHGVEPAWLEEHVADLTRRFANRALGDTVFRLGRDPERKLGPADRLVGAARLAQGANVHPDALSWGIAAGYCFDDEDDPLAIKLQERLAAEGIDTVLADVSGITANEPLGIMVRRRFHALRGEQTT